MNLANLSGDAVGGYFAEGGRESNAWRGAVEYPQSVGGSGWLLGVREAGREAGAARCSLHCCLCSRPFVLLKWSPASAPASSPASSPVPRRSSPGRQTVTRKHHACPLTAFTSHHFLIYFSMTLLLLLLLVLFFCDSILM